MTYLFWIDDIDIFGDQVIHFHVSDKPELDQDQDEYFTFIGGLDSLDAEEMDKQGIDCSNESECIKYAKEQKGILIPDEYKLICLSKF